MRYYDYLKSKYAMDAENTGRKHRNGTPCHAKSEESCPEHRKEAKRDEVDDVDRNDGGEAASEWMSRPASERTAALLDLRRKMSEVERKYDNTEIRLSDPMEHDGIRMRILSMRSKDFMGGSYVDAPDDFYEYLEKSGIPYMEMPTDHANDTSFIAIVESFDRD